LFFIDPYPDDALWNNQKNPSALLSVLPYKVNDFLQRCGHCFSRRPASQIVDWLQMAMLVGSERHRPLRMQVRRMRHACPNRVMRIEKGALGDVREACRWPVDSEFPALPRGGVTKNPNVFET
jgi:hypothetical protein